MVAAAVWLCTQACAKCMWRCARMRTYRYTSTTYKVRVRCGIARENPREISRKIAFRISRNGHFAFRRCEIGHFDVSTVGHQDTTSDTTAPDTLYAPRPSWTFQSTPSTTSSLGVDGAVQVFKLVDRVRQRGMPRRERRPARRPACRVGLASWLQSMQGEALRIRPRRGRAAARARVLPTLLRRSCTSLRASQPG